MSFKDYMFNTIDLTIEEQKILQPIVNAYCAEKKSAIICGKKKTVEFLLKYLFEENLVLLWEKSEKINQYKVYLNRENKLGFTCLVLMVATANK